jgi:fructose-bisphosphate aldolase class II
MGVTVEASLGKMPLSVGGVTKNLKLQMVKTDLDEAIKFCTETEIDNFAPSIGNYHELYSEKWPSPDFKLAKEIHTATNIPMTAHGCTGISKSQIQEAKASGFVKFNTGTLYQEFFRKRMKIYTDTYEGYPSAFDTLWSAMCDLKEHVKNQIRSDYGSANYC